MGNVFNRRHGYGHASSFSDPPMEDQSREEETLSAAPPVEDIARESELLSPQAGDGDHSLPLHVLQTDGHGNSVWQACDTHSQRPARCPACSKHAENYQLLLNEKQFIEQRLLDERENSWQDMQELRRHLQLSNTRFENEMRACEAEVMKYKHKCNVLHSQIESLEKIHSQNAIADSGSYQDFSATPPLLQTAVDAVSDATAMCASDLFSRLRKQGNVNLLRHGFSVKQGRSSAMKAALQGFVCRIFFKGFENMYFSLRDDSIPSFQIPSERKRELFLAFKRFRDGKAGQVIEEDEDFRIFVNAKAHEMKQEMSTRLLAIHENTPHAGSESLLHLIQDTKFLRLAKAVWALHKLVMAFEPSAEIFRVGQGSPFNDVYMEDNAYDDEDAEDCGSEVEKRKGEKQVDTMCVPGFLVRQTVIKCKVFCLADAQQAEVCGTSLDSSTPMIIEDELP